jgi:hypothetical protein
MSFWFGCRHKNTSFPITRPKNGHTLHRGANRSLSRATSRTYVVCLECGLEMPYDWDEMRVVKAAETRAAAGEPEYEPAIPI